MYLKNLHFEGKLVQLFLGKVLRFALQDQYQLMQTFFVKNLTINSPDISCFDFISSLEDDKGLQTQFRKTMARISIQILPNRMYLNKSCSRIIIPTSHVTTSKICKTAVLDLWSPKTQFEDSPFLHHFCIACTAVLQAQDFLAIHQATSPIKN